MKTNTYKHMTVVSKYVYINQLNQIFRKYNITYHRKIRKKTINVNVNSYIGVDVEKNAKVSEFQHGNNARI